MVESFYSGYWGIGFDTFGIVVNFLGPGCYWWGSGGEINGVVWGWVPQPLPIWGLAAMPPKNIFF